MNEHALKVLLVFVLHCVLVLNATSHNSTFVLINFILKHDTTLVFSLRAALE